MLGFWPSDWFVRAKITAIVVALDEDSETSLLPHVLLWQWALTGIMEIDVPDGNGGYFKEAIPIPPELRLKAAIAAAPYFTPRLSAKIIVDSSSQKSVEQARLAIQRLANPFDPDFLSDETPVQKHFAPEVMENKKR